MEINVLTIIYLLASVTFIIGLKMLSNPATARRGNLIAATGMTIAILGTIFLYKDDAGNNLHNYGWIFGGIVIGGIIGTLAAKKVKMTAMPEMVSMFNGMGGACAALISIVEFNHLVRLIGYPPDLFVLPIGGADMPIVISLLNSFTGVAAACGGFLYDNKVMLTGGILVGAAGTLLTILMCKAMNRSLKNVLIGNFGGSAAIAAAKGLTGMYKEISVSDTAMAMSYARKVMIVPGYGLAVAQAQHVCEELEEMLEERGVEVKYAIHPVAGRMPGHMNVLLAEANVSYDKLLEMEQAND